MKKSIVEKMKEEQILYNLDKAGINLELTAKIPNPYEEWAEKIFEDNKELFKKTNKEEFIKFVIYGE